MSGLDDFSLPAGNIPEDDSTAYSQDTSGHARLSAAAASAPLPPVIPETSSPAMDEAQIIDAEVQYAIAKAGNPDNALQDSMTSSPYIEDERRHSGNGGLVTSERRTDDDENKSSCKKPWLLGALLCLLVLGGAGAAVYFLVFQEDDSGGDTNGKGSKNGTGDDPSPGGPSGPTNPPSPSVPTSMPTANPLKPINDLCQDAILVQSSSSAFSSVIGNLTFATADGFAENIFNVCPGDLQIPHANDAPGLWYKLVGEGLDVRLSTCHNTTTARNTEIVVLRDTRGGKIKQECTLDSLECADVASNVDSIGRNDNNCDAASDVMFRAHHDEIYYIYVKGDGDGGSFQLTLESMPLSNDSCDGAIPLATDGSVTPGTTDTATFATLETCNGITVTSPGVWYTFVGTGTEEFVSLCHATDYDSKLTLYSGSSCQDLQCVGGDDDGCGSGKTSTLDFDSVAGQTYFVYVHGFQGETGNFGIAVGKQEDRYPDFCDEAKPLTIGVPMLSNTIYADNSLDPPSQLACGESLSSYGPEVWYTVL